MKYTARRPKANVNVTPTSPVREFFLLVGGLLGIAVGIYILLGLAVDLIAPRISVNFENKMGRLFLRTMESNRVAGEEARFVQGLVDRLQETCVKLPYHFRVQVQKKPMINAMALPGGHILLFQGLLEKVSSENELVFILGHEMGHYAHRDHLKGLGRAFVFLTLSTVLFGADSSVGKMLAQALNLTEMGFSRKQETWADEFALEAMDCVYGHVAGATDFFEKIPKAQDPGKYGHYFASHPENQKRIAHLKAIIGSKGLRTADRQPLPWKQGTGKR